LGGLILSHHIETASVNVQDFNMRLSKNDSKLFFKLHPSYLFYANSLLKLYPDVESIEDFMDLSFHDKSEIRTAARQKPDILFLFIRENPFGFNDVELEIVSSWQYAVDGSFYLMRYEKDYALFLDTDTAPKVYAVTSLNKPLKNVLGDNLPVYVKTVLLPFKNHIIYDGFIFTYPVIFDDTVAQELQADLENWLKRQGVIKSLPFIGENQVQSDAEKLRYYLRSHWNRDVYKDDITALLQKKRNLTKQYYELSGKLDARDAQIYFRKMDIQDIWCAVLDGRILTTAKSREGVLETLNAILPKGRKLYPYIFHFKK
jgi:hypothetical protein